MSETYTRRAAMTTAGLAAGAATLHADHHGPRLERRRYQPSRGGAEREHYLYLPPGFDDDPDEKWPVLLFLHGNGERGDGLDELKYTLLHGPLREAWIQKRDLPFVILQPQLDWYTRRRPTNPRPDPGERSEGPGPERRHGSRMTTPMIRTESGEPPRWGSTLPEGWGEVEQDLLAMVDAAVADYRGDPDRVYLTGLSYGGFGTWLMAAKHPDRWAAAAPICGAGDPTTVQPIADARLPIWVYQGGRDPVVQTEYVLRTVRALEAAGHPDVRFTVHEDLGHNVWTRVYQSEDFYRWLLAQRRS